MLDPFGGSGSTAIAAYDTGRAFTSIEIEAKYHAEAQKRFDKHQNGSLAALMGGGRASRVSSSLSRHRT